MPNFRNVLGGLLIVALPFALGGCPAAIVGGLAAAGGAGYTANQERGAGGSVDDFQIKTNIQNAWMKANPLMQTNLTINVYEGRTLLTGTAPTPEFRAQAKEIASQVPGVRTVYDEIEVSPPESAWDSTKDTWITSRVRTELAFNPDVRSVNYTIETFFFFQAEDGIRDLYVTGVQTCALPISKSWARRCPRHPVTGTEAAWSS